MSSETVPTPSAQSNMPGGLGTSTPMRPIAPTPVIPPIASGSSQPFSRGPAPIFTQASDSSSSAGAKKLVKPRAREVPRFDANKPEELARFLSEMEEAFEEVGIRDSNTRKTQIGRYTDTNTQEQWENLPRFHEMSWEEFKLKLLEMYPEAEKIKRGAISRLERVCKLH